MTRWGACPTPPQPQPSANKIATRNPRRHSRSPPLSPGISLSARAMMKQGKVSVSVDADTLGAQRELRVVAYFPKNALEKAGSASSDLAIATASEVWPAASADRAVATVR